MTWLQKMDAVLECLYALQADNPVFEDLEKWLSPRYPKVEKGQIQDVTLYLWREQMMYFERGGLRTADYDDRDPKARYLIACKGKLFWDSIGGFVAQDKQNSKKAAHQSWQTWAIVVGTVLAGLYGLVEIVKALRQLFLWFCS